MRMMSAMFEGLGAMMAAIIGIYLVVAFVLVYFAADSQGRRSGNRDPALGARIVTTFMLTLTFQTALAGLSALLGALLDGGPEMLVKLGLGLILGAVVASVLPFVVHNSRLKAVTGSATDFVGRKAYGINAIITGLASVAGLMGLSVAMVMGADLQPIMITATLVYTAGAVVTLLPLGKVAPSA